MALIFHKDFEGLARGVREQEILAHRTVAAAPRRSPQPSGYGTLQAGRRVRYNDARSIMTDVPINQDETSRRVLVAGVVL